MTKKEKLTDRIRSNPKGVRFEDACKLVMLYGFEEKGGKGSHRVFTKKGVKEIISGWRGKTVSGKATVDDYR